MDSATHFGPAVEPSVTPPSPALQISPSLITVWTFGLSVLRFIVPLLSDFWMSQWPSCEPMYRLYTGYWQIFFDKEVYVLQLKEGIWMVWSVTHAHATLWQSYYCYVTKANFMCQVDWVRNVHIAGKISHHWLYFSVRVFPTEFGIWVKKSQRASDCLSRARIEQRGWRKSNYFFLFELGHPSSYPGLEDRFSGC